MEQHIFQDGDRYFLVDITESFISLKIKENGWDDIWSLPIKKVK